MDMRRELSGVMSEGWRSQRRPGQGSSFIRSLTSPRGSEKLFCTEESHTSPAGRKSRDAWLEVRRRDNARGVRAFACCFLGFSASNRGRNCGQHRASLSTHLSVHRDQSVEVERRSGAWFGRRRISRGVQKVPPKAEASDRAGFRWNSFICSKTNLSLLPPTP